MFQSAEAQALMSPCLEDVNGEINMKHKINNAIITKRLMKMY